MEEGSPLLGAAAAGSRPPLAEPCGAVRGRARGAAKPVAAICLGLAVYFVVAGRRPIPRCRRRSAHGRRHGARARRSHVRRIARQLPGALVARVLPVGPRR